VLARKELCQYVHKERSARRNHGPNQTENPNLPPALWRCREDITPPVGIYHPLWGAARHHRATGVHRPLFGEVMVFEPTDGEEAESPGFIRVQLDLPGLVKSQDDGIRQAISESSGWPAEQIIISYSHTHAAGWFVPDRFSLPGGALIEPYLAELCVKLGEACQRAWRIAARSDDLCDRTLFDGGQS
jgi:hypothetical protein